MEHCSFRGGSHRRSGCHCPASLGESVTVLVRPERLAVIRKLVSGPSVRRHHSFRRTSQPRSQIRLTCSGSHQDLSTQAAFASVQSLPRWVVPLLNGVDHVDVLRAHFGRRSCAAATIAVEARALPQDGFIQIVVISPGALGAGPGESIARYATRIHMQVHPEEQNLLWSKLCS